MDAFLTWLEFSWLSVAIVESESIWRFPLVLVFHTVGVALTAGTIMAMSLRVTGLMKSVPLSFFRPLFPLFWIGFAINAVTGTLLFMMAATSTGTKPLFYAKLFLVLVTAALVRPLRAIVHSDAIVSDRDIPSRAKALAGLSLVCWIGVIVTGRLIAYSGAFSF